MAASICLPMLTRHPISQTTGSAWTVMRPTDCSSLFKNSFSRKGSKEHDPELKWVYSKLLHEVYFRLDAAMNAFFRRVKNGETPGFPRVRPRRNFFTLCYPAMYIKVEGNYITLPTGGKGKNKRYPDVVAKLTEEAPTGYKEVAISRDGQGHYYASFVHDVEEETHEHDGVLAIDLGVKTLATGVNEQGRF